MRMNFNKSSQLLMVTAASLLAAGLVTACSTLTTDFVFVASSRAAGPYNYGEIDVFEINAVSGAMRQIPTSPFPSGGRNPVAEAVSTDFLNLYVVNQDDNTIVQFAIGPDGKVYPESTVNTPGIFPLAETVSGSNLFVLDTYQPLPSCSNAEPCSGSVAVFPILPASGTGSNATLGGGLGAPATNTATGTKYWPLAAPGSPSDAVAPTAINVLHSGAFAYVTGYDSTSNTGYVFGFSVASGALTPLKAGAPLAAMPHPSAIASDSSSSYVYIVDSTAAKLFAYAVGADGSLSELPASPVPTGNQPSAIAADPKYPYIYVANAVDGTMSAYSIGVGGAPASIAAYPVGIQPVAIGIDPSTSHFIFTANFLGSNISDFELDAATGALVHTQHSPYTSNAQPTAVAAVPHKVTQ